MGVELHEAQQGLSTPAPSVPQLPWLTSGSCDNPQQAEPSSPAPAESRTPDCVTAFATELIKPTPWSGSRRLVGPGCQHLASSVRILRHPQRDERWLPGLQELRLAWASLLSEALFCLWENPRAAPPT